MFSNLKWLNSPNPKITLITALFGNLDELKEIPQQSTKVDMFCFTDNYSIPTGNYKGWNIIHPAYPRYDFNNRMKAKYFRMLSHKVPELKKYDIIIWIDSSIDVINKKFISFMINNIQEKELCFFKHSVRKCIYDESIFSKQAVKYSKEHLDEQIYSYRMDKYPPNNGLFETGCFSRIINKTTNKIMEDWWHENIKYTYQDQVSLPYVLWKNKFFPHIIDKNIHNNEYCFRVSRPVEKEML